MAEQNNQFSNLDDIVKGSFVYLRQNYRQLILPFVLTCAALVLFSIVQDFILSYLYSRNAPPILPHTKLFIACEYALRAFFGLSYLLIFPVMLLVTRNVVLGRQISLEEIRSQPKQRIIHILFAITKLLIPLYLINFAFSSWLGFLTKPLVSHLIEGQSTVSIVGDGSDKGWPLPFWAYDNALEVINYIHATSSFLTWSMLILTWYIAARWSMTLVFAALDKSCTFKQSVAFTKGYVGLIFFSILFVSVLFYTLSFALNEALIMLILNFTSSDFLEGGTFLYIGYLAQLLGRILLTLKWILNAVMLSKIYLLLESRGK